MSELLLDKNFYTFAYKYSGLRALDFVYDLIFLQIKTIWTLQNAKDQKRS